MAEKHAGTAQNLPMCRSDHRDGRKRSNINGMGGKSQK